MNTKILVLRFLIAGALGLYCGGQKLCAQVSAAFTYQGQLTAAGNPASGNFDMEFCLYETNLGGSPVGGPLIESNVGVTNGLFEETLDFGTNSFTGQALWLGIAVRPSAGDQSFTVLSRRQVLSPVPYAVYAMTPAGPAGAQGAPGPTGPQGPQGPPGANTASAISSIPQMEVFTNSGVFVVPTNITGIMVDVWGGGGGGGNAASNNVGSYEGGNGGGGGYGRGVFSVTNGNSFQVTIGAGGASGSAGGTSSFGSLIYATGGNPGGNGVTSSGDGGTGGTSNGAFNMAGGSGDSTYVTYMVGRGGSAGNGGSGGAIGFSNTNAITVNGFPGMAPGGGGGGGTQRNYSGTYYVGAGGAGGQGRVVVYW